MGNATLFEKTPQFGFRRSNLDWIKLCFDRRDKRSNLFWIYVWSSLS